MIDENLLKEAKSIVVREKRCTVSMLQRRFTIGYTRASLLIEHLAARGVEEAKIAIASGKGGIANGGNTPAEMRLVCWCDHD